MEVYCAISAIGSATATNSATATLTVLEDTVPPTIVSAFGEYDSGTSNQFVDLTFNKLMNVASLTDPANYSIAGHTISGVMLFTNDLGVGSGTMVVLQLSKPLTGSFTVNVTNVQSFSGFPIAANTSVAGTLDPLSSIDIGIFWTNGVTYYEEPGSYVVNSSGQDIWNQQDGFRFVYGTRTNNFDVVVQVPWILPGGRWSDAGLMARETIDPSDGGSRMIAVYTMATAAQIGQDGGAGANIVQMCVRDTTDGTAGFPADYIGDGEVRPDYPNQWLRLTRQTDGTNDLFTAYASTNKVNWTFMGSLNPMTSGADTPFPSVVNVGMALSADSYSPDEYLTTATFQNFGDYVAPPTLTATLAATKESLTISWQPAGESLYSSPVLGSAANWKLVTTNNPATVTMTGPAMFFRVGP
jgi:hypothetical protein